MKGVMHLSLSWFEKQSAKKLIMKMAIIKAQKGSLL